MLLRVGNLLPRPRNNSKSTDYFFLRLTASTSTPTCISLNSWNNNWIDHQALDINLEIGNSKCVWRQTPLDLTRDSHTKHKEQPQNVVRVFLFILKTKHKILHVKWAWAELENFVENQSAPVSIDWVKFSIDRAKQIYIVNPTVHSILTLHLNILCLRTQHNV